MCCKSFSSTSGDTVLLLGLVTILSKYHFPVPLVICACFPSTKHPSVSLEKKKRCIFPQVKGFCPRIISYPGTTNQGCLCWALGPYVNSESVSSFLSLAQAASDACFCQILLQPWITSLFSNTFAGFQRGWSDATRQRALRSSFLRVREEKLMEKFSQAQYIWYVCSQVSVVFVPEICELCRAEAMPHVYMVYSMKGI